MNSFNNEQELNTKFGANSPNAQYHVNEDGTSQMYNFTAPPQQSFDNKEMAGSLQRVLAQNIGEYVVIEFLIGTAQIVRKQGLMYNVATTFVVLFDDTVNNFIVCDIFSIKFVYFYFPGNRPDRNYNILPNGTATPYTLNTQNNNNNNNMQNRRR